jgi:hypothetical protein
MTLIKIDNLDKLGGVGGRTESFMVQILVCAVSYFLYPFIGQFFTAFLYASTLFYLAFSQITKHFCRWYFSVRSTIVNNQLF